jgi:hypothetical protein
MSQRKSLMFKLWSDARELQDVLYKISLFDDRYKIACENVHMCNVNIKCQNIYAIALSKIMELYDIFTKNPVFYHRSTVAYVYNTLILSKLDEAICELERYADCYPDYSVGIDRYNAIYDEIDRLNTHASVYDLLEEYVKTSFSEFNDYNKANDLIDSINSELSGLGYRVSIPHMIPEEKQYKGFFRSLRRK